MEQKTQVQQKPQVPANATPKAPLTGALAKAQQVRKLEAERRSKLQPRQLFREDLADVTNRVATLLDGQRGSMMGVVRRGVVDGNLEAGECLKAIAYIEDTLKRVRVAAEKSVEGKPGFSL